jgi:hypothetical protein
MLDGTIQRVPADVPVTAILKRGDAAAAIVDDTHAGAHDLIVIGYASVDEDVPAPSPEAGAPCSHLRHAEADVALTARRSAAHGWVSD